MKTKLILYSIIAVLGLTLLFAFKQGDRKQYVYVYVSNNMYDHIMITIYKDGVINQYHVNNKQRDDGGASYKKQWDLIINNVINDNYRLKSSTSSSYGTSIIYNEYIFEKE